MQRSTNILEKSTIVSGNLPQATLAKLRERHPSRGARWELEADPRRVQEGVGERERRWHTWERPGSKSLR